MNNPTRSLLSELRATVRRWDAQVKDLTEAAARKENRNWSQDLRTEATAIETKRLDLQSTLERQRR